MVRKLTRQLANVLTCELILTSPLRKGENFIFLKHSVFEKLRALLLKSVNFFNLTKQLKVRKKRHWFAESKNVAL
jgi:hypothetical protein